MNLKTVKISPDEFQEYTGIDLKMSLGQQTASFLERNQTRLNMWIDAHGFFGSLSPAYREPSETQIRYYKIALVEQNLYILKNGDISVDAGRDDTGAQRISRAEIENLFLAPQAKQALICAGLFNKHIGGNGFKTKWWWGL